MKLSCAAAVVLTTALAAPFTTARACINDEETKGAERQFISRYARSETPSPPADLPSYRLRSVGLVGAGIGFGLLVGGAVALGVNSLDRRRVLTKLHGPDEEIARV